MTSSCLQVLEADNNSIENLEGVYHLPKLEEVLLKNNSILKSKIYVHEFVREHPVLILSHQCHQASIFILSLHSSHSVLVTQEMCESALSAQGSMLQNKPSKECVQLTVCEERDVKDTLHSKVVFTEFENCSGNKPLQLQLFSAWIISFYLKLCLVIE